MNTLTRIFYTSVLVLSLIFIFSISNNLLSQPVTEWVKRYNSTGNYDDYVTDMAIDNSGNVYLTGYTIKSTFDYDFLTIKYNNAGVFQWAKTYDGSAHEYDAPVGIEVDDSGYVYVAGSSKDSVTNFDYLLIKYDKFGDTIYVKRYNHFLFDEASSMCIDKFNNIFISGSGMRCENCIPGYLTVKYNSESVFQWSATFKGPSMSSDFVRDIITDTSGNLYVTGQVIGTMGTITIKYDQKGDTVWIRESSSGGNIIRAYSDNLYLLEADRRILNYNFNGKLNWIIINEGIFLDMIIDDSKSLFITGLSGSSSITIKINMEGDTIWTKKFQSIPNNSGNRTLSISNDKNGNIFVTGYSNYNTLWNRFLSLAYDKNGNLLWSKYYNNNDFFLQHEAVKVKTDTLGNIFVVGNSQGNGTGWDIALIKYSKLTGINQSTNNEPKEYILYPNYPNPFNPETKINYELPNDVLVKIIIYDALGREVKILLNEFKIAGRYNVAFKGNDLPSGVYYYRFSAEGETGNFMQAKKMLLLK